MKSNLFFQKDDVAVSPVIGVVLMVAITVVLAAVVFVLVGDLGSQNNEAPTAAFQSDRSGEGGEILLIKVGGQAINAEDLQISPATCVLKDPSGNEKLVGELHAGDFIACSEDGDVTIADGVSNTLLYRGLV